MKKNNPLLRIPENGVFWLLLFSLAIGSAVSLHSKLTERAEIPASGRVLSPIHPVSSPAVISESPLLSPLDMGLTLESPRGRETLFFRPAVFP